MLKKIKEIKNKLEMYDSINTECCKKQQKIWELNRKIKKLKREIEELKENGNTRECEEPKKETTKRGRRKKDI